MRRRISSRVGCSQASLIDLKRLDFPRTDEASPFGGKAGMCYGVRSDSGMWITVSAQQSHTLELRLAFQVM